LTEPTPTARNANGSLRTAQDSALPELIAKFHAQSTRADELEEKLKRAEERLLSVEHEKYDLYVDLTEIFFSALASSKDWWYTFGLDDARRILSLQALNNLEQNVRTKLSEAYDVTRKVSKK